MTLTNRILQYVEYHPGKTAWSIAKALDQKSSSVSSILRRKILSGGPLSRSFLWIDERPGPWRYYRRSS